MHHNPDRYRDSFLCLFFGILYETILKRFVPLTVFRQLQQQLDHPAGVSYNVDIQFFSNSAIDLIVASKSFVLKCLLPFWSMLLSLLSLVVDSRQMKWHFHLQPFFVNSQNWNMKLYHPIAGILDALSLDMEKEFWGLVLSSPSLRCETQVQGPCVCVFWHEVQLGLMTPCRAAITHPAVTMIYIFLTDPKKQMRVHGNIPLTLVHLFLLMGWSSDLAGAFCPVRVRGQQH